MREDNKLSGQWHEGDAALRRGRQEPAGDPPIRYLFGRGRIGVPDGPAFARAAAGLVLLCAAAPWAVRQLGRRGARRGVSALQRWWAAGMCRQLGMRLEVAGAEQIDPGARYIVTPLHEGFVDVVALLHLPLPLRFVVRDELLEWPLLGPYLRDSGQIAIRPEQGAAGYRCLLRQAAGVEESIVVFPQGSILGIETDFAPGAFALARALRRPVLPVALSGSHRVWEHPYTPRLRFGQRVSLRVLPPIPAEAARAATVEELRADVQRRLKDAALSGEMAAPRRFVPARDGYWDGYAYRIDPRFAALAADIDRHREQAAAQAQAVGEP